MSPRQRSHPFASSDALSFRATPHPALIPHEAPGSSRRYPQIPATQRRKGPLMAAIPAYPRSARKRHDRPVTPEVAGSSPVAPVFRSACKSAMFCCLHRQRFRLSSPSFAAPPASLESPLQGESPAKRGGIPRIGVSDDAAACPGRPVMRVPSRGWLELPRTAAPPARLRWPTGDLECFEWQFVSRRSEWRVRRNRPHARECLPFAAPRSILAHRALGGLRGCGRPNASHGEPARRGKGLRCVIVNLPS